MKKYCPNCEELQEVTLEKHFEHFKSMHDENNFTCELLYYKCSNCGEMFEDGILLNNNLEKMRKAVNYDMNNK